MGASYSFLEAEKRTWIEHTLKFDGASREANLKILESIKDGADIYLSFVENEFGGIKYQHWFVTDTLYFIEFGSPSLDIYNARVKITTSSYSKYPITGEAKKGRMDRHMRERVGHVLGLCNYSLCLRNCEHVANYIFRGRWISSQMDSQGTLMANFTSYLMQSQVRMVNSFPSSLRLSTSGKSSAPLYSFLEKYYTAKNIEYYLDYNEDTYNVVLIGPTGAGKSHLINVIFNQFVCDSEVSHRSVTREICFIRGNGNVYDVNKKAFVNRNIIVADTVGLCDTEWDDQKIFNLIKGRVSENFRKIDAVFLVFRADRLLKEHVENIRKMLQWLQYDKYSLRFQFVATYADYLDEKKKADLRSEAIEIFGLGARTRKRLVLTGEVIETLVYTGFPPENSLNELTKARVKESYNSLKYLLTMPGNTERVPLNSSMCTLL